MRTDFSPTIENIELAMAQLAELIERYPRKDCLWLYFDRLEAEREKLMDRHGRLAAARARVRVGSPRRMEARSS